MTRTGFVIANLWRKKTRTVLTLLSIVTAFLLFGLLQSVNVLFSAGADFVGATRLVTQARVSFTQSLPMRLLPQIESVPGVERVMWSQWFGGVWQENTQLVIQAADPARLRDVYPEFVMPDAEWKAFEGTRTGMIAGRNLATKYGWKIGQQDPDSLEHLSAAGREQGLGLRPRRHLRRQGRGVAAQHQRRLDQFRVLRRGQPVRARARRRLCHPALRPRRRIRGRGDDRPHVRELPGRNQDADREGLQYRLLQADRRHRADRALDPVRGVLHACCSWSATRSRRACASASRSSRS